MHTLLTKETRQSRRARATSRGREKVDSVDALPRAAAQHPTRLDLPPSLQISEHIFVNIFRRGFIYMLPSAWRNFLGVYILLITVSSFWCWQDTDSIARARRSS